MSITELTEKLGMAQPTISINIQMLETAGLVETTQRLGRGKICARSCNSIYMELPNVSNESLEYKEIQMPVGLYSDFQVKPSCGMVGSEGVIGNIDDAPTFYLPERAAASLLWFSEDGFVEYRFPNLLKLGQAQSIQALSISAELCSEAWSFKEDWPSDITLSVNGIDIGTWTSPSDFGDKKGVLTPSWWHGVTQYGLLSEWRVTNDSSTVNGESCSTVTLKDLQLQYGQPIIVRFAVKPDALNCRGMNMFGKHFGNSPQDIKLVLFR